MNISDFFQKVSRKKNLYVPCLIILRADLSVVWFVYPISLSSSHSFSCDILQDASEEVHLERGENYALYNASVNKSTMEFKVRYPLVQKVLVFFGGLFNKCFSFTSKKLVELHKTKTLQKAYNLTSLNVT